MLTLDTRQNFYKIHNQNILKENDLIFKKPDLYFSRRGGEVLVVEPGTGSWVILDNKHFNALSTIDSTVNFKTVLERNNIFLKEELENFLSILYKSNIISINGEYHFDEKKFGINRYLWPNLFVVFVSDKCNINCAYCYYSADKNGKIMSEETLNNILKRIYEELPYNYQYYTIAFHGGEPLMAMDIIKKTYNLVKTLDTKHGKFTKFICQTNGTLLNENNIPALKSIDVGVGVSIDGPREVHDRFRVYSNGKGTFDEVFAGMRLAKKMGLSPGCLATIYEPEDFVKSFEFFIENDFTSFRLSMTQCFSGRPSKLSYPEDRNYRFAENFLKTVDMALEYNREHPGVLHFADLDEILNNIVLKTRDYMCLRSPCGAANSIMCFTAEGDIYPCDCMTGEKNLKVANISDKRPLYKILSESEIINSFRERTVWNIPKCSSCVWRNFCGGGCAGRSYGSYKNVLRESSFCGFFKVIYEKLIWKLHDDGSLLNLISRRVLNNGGYGC